MAVSSTQPPEEDPPPLTQAPARPSQGELKQEYLDSPADFPYPIALLHIKSEGGGTSNGNPLYVFDSHEPCTFGRDPALVNVVFPLPDLHKIGVSGKSFTLVSDEDGTLLLTVHNRCPVTVRGGEPPMESVQDGSSFTLRSQHTVDFK